MSLSHNTDLHMDGDFPVEVCQLPNGMVFVQIGNWPSRISFYVNGLEAAQAFADMGTAVLTLAEDHEGLREPAAEDNSMAKTWAEMTSLYIKDAS